MSTDHDSNGSVRFTTKELLTALDGKLDRILQKLDEKADKSAVTSLEGRVTTIERQGSPGLEETKARLHKLSGTVAAIEMLQASRAHLDDEQRKHELRIDSLESWRNRIIGALTVIGPLSGVAGGVVVHYLT